MEILYFTLAGFVLAIAAYVLGQHSVYQWFFEAEEEFHTKEQYLIEKTDKIKEEYEMKVKALEDLIEKLEKEETKDYKPDELFAPGIELEYGLPRKLG